MNKYLYVTSYWHYCDLEKEGLVDEFSKTILEKEGFRYDENTDENAKEELRKVLMENAETSDRTRFLITHCSKADAEAGEMTSADSPLGYLTIYVRINCLDKGEPSVGYASYESDFRNWLYEDFWDIFATMVKKGYEKLGYTDVSVDGCTKSEYDLCSSDDVIAKMKW